MINISERVLKVLSSTYTMTLAVSDNDGPWAATVIFVYDDEFNLYWISDPETRHSKAILATGRAAGTITLSTKDKEPNLGLQFAGKAEQLEGPQFALILKHWAKRGHPAPDPSQALKLLDGDCWFKLTPEKLFLIDEENFGFKRQEVR